MAVENPITEMLYRKYANEFWDEITSALWANNESSFEYLPIVFTDKKICNKNGNSIWGVTHLHTNTATNIATIYPVVYISEDRSKEEIELTIRHETIHYLLGAQYNCHSDNSALFWLICECFNAGAYLPMNEKSRRIYNIAKPFISKIFEAYKLNKSEKNAINLSLMLTVIDTAEFSQTPDYIKLAEYLKVCECSACL